MFLGLKLLQREVLEAKAAGGMLSTQKCGVGAAGADFTGCAIAATQHF
jgi:hypothetical protein